MGLGSIVFIIYKFQQYQLDTQKAELEFIQNIGVKDFINGVGILVIVLVLMFLNWYIEMKKWKILIEKIHPVSWKLALQSVLCGVAAGVFTPYRLGSFLGRVILLPHKKRVIALVLNLLGNIAQFLCMLTFGLIGLIFWLFTSIKPIPSYLFIIVLSSLVFAIFLVYWFLNISKFVHLFNYLPVTKKWPRYFLIMQNLETISMGKKLLRLSVIRYFVILIQYLLLFYLFQFPVNIYITAYILMGIFIIYHFLPTLNLFELGATKASIFLLMYEFTGFTNDSDMVVILSLVTFAIWIINLVIPSLMGSVFLFKAKLLKEKE
jgi:hypothetical protein